MLRRLWQRKPGLDLRKSGIAGRVPLHRRAASVSTQPTLGQVFLHDISDSLAWYRHILHSELIAIVDRRRSAQRKQQHCGNASLSEADTACYTRSIVIPEHPVRPTARRQRRLVFLHQIRKGLWMPSRGQQDEVEWQMQPAQVTTVVLDQPFNRQIDFPDEQAVLELLGHAPHFGNNGMHLRPVCGVEREQRMMWRVIRPELWIGWIVAKRLVFDEMPNDIDAKTVNPASQPEAHHSIDGGADLRIAPVQVGLLGQECMIVILSRCLIVGPGASTELR